MKIILPFRGRIHVNRTPVGLGGPALSKHSGLSPNPKSAIHNPKSRGVALVVTLAMLVLVTIAVMAFFLRATANRAVESTRANQVLAADLSRSAQDYIRGQILAEITENSDENAVNGVSIFMPENASFAVPQRPLPDTAPFNSADFSNLLRRSVKESINGVGEPNASAHSTADAARNKRRIPAERWNAPFLLGGGGFTADALLPNWIYINRDGRVTDTPSTDAVGRFAYNLYNIGGLLDANIAGYPASVTSDKIDTLKFSVAGADLTILPGMDDSKRNNFLNWRNAASVTDSVAYLAMVDDYASTGFLRPPTGVQPIQSRQDLIRLARQGSIGLGTDTLPYLTAFSRSMDAPAFTPDPDREKIKSQTPSLPTFGLDDQFNPSLIDTRVTTPFTRDDGSQALVGEPLLKKKFPLNRLSLLESASGRVDQGDPIHKYFGLTRSSSNDPWIYDHGDRTRILRLEEVADAGREPDFFELLQACIPIGSLGKSLGKTNAYRNAPGNDVARDTFTKYQILQIGVNLIDQWDADSYPTRVVLEDGNNFTFAGIENLPYLTRIFSNTFKSNQPDPANPGAPAAETMQFFLHPEVWNPHQGANTPPSEPSEFRFVIEGNYNVEIVGDGLKGPLSVDDTRGLLFSPSPVFSEPRLLDTVATPSDPQDRMTPSGGTAITAMQMYSGPLVVPGGGQQHRILPDASISYHLQYRQNGQWITYSSMREHMQYFQASSPQSVGFDAYPATQRFRISRSDPRVERFGFILALQYASGGQQALGTRANETQRPDFRENGAQVWDIGKIQLYPGWNALKPNVTAIWPWGYSLGTLTGNKPKDPGQTTSYEDADGVNRLGDAAFSSDIHGEPMQTNNLASRPVILNRPFRSVAEMGFAGRDLPWKTLDFFTSDSADGALLDAFCVHESNGSDFVAGQIDLNSSPPAVLASLLAGAETFPGNAITAAQARSLADEIHTETAANPLSNLADIGKTITAKLSIAAEMGSTQNAAIKTRREFLTRALAEVGQVRTWNLLADIVVQSGQFPGAGGTDAGDFVVEAEERTWLSFSIDRPTATVLQTQTERIQE